MKLIDEKMYDIATNNGYTATDREGTINSLNQQAMAKVQPLVDALDLALSLLSIPEHMQDDEWYENHRKVIAALKQWEGECEHGKGLNDYCEPCGRIHNET